MGDGNGPQGLNPAMGRGMGGGRGRRGGAGPGGNCICPSCRTKVAHQPGIPCASLSCPKCGTRMVRE
ncbi:MAG: hypothetical protein DRP75_01945 [Candidatus Omnitrophota bacterium]|nr:MAG: hypothetical protein DRP75_01945 [Candidatus Omnitrophota bacterium]